MANISASFNYVNVSGSAVGLTTNQTFTMSSLIGPYQYLVIQGWQKMAPTDPYNIIGVYPVYTAGNWQIFVNLLMTGSFTGTPVIKVNYYTVSG